MTARVAEKIDPEKHHRQTDAHIDAKIWQDVGIIGKPPLGTVVWCPSTVKNRPTPKGRPVCCRLLEKQ
ncbi:MAG: hypothetical protein ACI9IV_000382 [Paracoccaceae bacterium]|jgi:hypothetical protein